ncbi:MAG: NAD(P)-dependent oxidoreductase, partial [Pseudomonadota bacterium]
MKSIPLLVSSRGHAPTRQQIVDLFDTSSLDGIEKMDAEQRAAIRGVGCLFDALGRKQFDLLPNLEIVSSFGVGYDQIDAKAAAERGVIVTHTPGVLDDEVADTALGLLLSTLRELPRAETYLRDGNWITEGPYPLSRLTLRGRKIGIFGMGRIGTAIARRLEGFGVSIAYHNRSKVPDCTYQYFSSLMELAGSVDTLINVAPATGQTQNAVDSKILQALGPTGVLGLARRGCNIDERIHT